VIASLAIREATLKKNEKIGGRVNPIIRVRGKGGNSNVTIRESGGSGALKGPGVARGTGKKDWGKSQKIT